MRVHMSQNKLFLGNLAFKLDENDLQNYFEPFGTILDVKIPTDRATIITLFKRDIYGQES